MKLRVGYESLDQEVNTMSELRKQVSSSIELMVDYNQALKPEEALERCKALDDLELLWIEEPISAELLEIAATLTTLTQTPIQLGENLWSPTEVDRALNLKSSDYLMPDVVKIGWAIQWLRSAHLAAKNGIPVSSHMYPEISVHLIAAIDNAHYVEYADWTKRQFSGHQEPQDNRVRVGDTPGFGLV